MIRETPDNALIPFDGLEPIRVRRNGLELLQSRDGSQYLRRGPAPLIAAELEHHQHLVRLGYPVPRILASGPTWFVEASLGTEHFGGIFRRFPPEHPERPEAFAHFVAIIRQYAEAQGREDSAPIQRGILEEHIAFDEVDSLYKGADHDALCTVREQVLMALDGAEGIRCHGDFNAFNILTGGVIDFEDGFLAPIAYDLVTVIATPLAFATEEDLPGTEMPSHYSFTKQEQRELAAILSAHCEATGGSHIVESALLRWVWHVRRMEAYPVVQRHRIGLLRPMLHAYANGTLSKEQALGIVPV